MAIINGGIPLDRVVGKGASPRSKSPVVVNIPEGLFGTIDSLTRVSPIEIEKAFRIADANLVQFYTALTNQIDIPADKALLLDDTLSITEQADTIRAWMESNTPLLATIKELRFTDENMLNPGIMPEEIGFFTGLEKLDVSDSNLTSLPDVFGKLSNLKDVDLSGNKLTDFPPSIGALKNLVHLDLSHNELDALPPTFLNLKKLVHVNFSENKFEVFPAVLDALKEDGKITHDSLHTLPIRFNKETKKYEIRKKSPTIDPVIPTVGQSEKNNTMRMIKIGLLVGTIGSLAIAWFSQES